MRINESSIRNLKSLNKLRTAPFLDQYQRDLLMEELLEYTKEADWFTVGIMANSFDIAIENFRELENYFSWDSMKLITDPVKEGPVFLKANQNSGQIYIRNENGLGEGILISCQYNSIKDTITIGPLPLDFFKIKLKTL